MIGRGRIKWARGESIYFRGKGASSQGRLHLNKPDWGEAVDDGTTNTAGGAARRKPAPRAPAGQTRQVLRSPGGPVA